MTSKIEVPRELLERLANKADVFDDGSDGADAESARSVAQELRALLAAPEAPRQSEPVAWLTSDGRQLVFDGVLDQSQYVEQGMKPLYAAPLSPDHSGGGAGVVLPSNCRQRLASEGKPYPRSYCGACGKFSPKWLECDAAIDKVKELNQ